MLTAILRCRDVLAGRIQDVVVVPLRRHSSASDGDKVTHSHRRFSIHSNQIIHSMAEIISLTFFKVLKKSCISFYNENRQYF